LAGFNRGVPLIDTHTHLESFARRGELPAILERARTAGLEALVTIGTDTDDWSLYRDLAREHAGFVHYTAGLHPCSVGEDWAARVAQLEKFWSGTGLPTREERTPRTPLPGPARPASGAPLGAPSPAPTPLR